MNRRSFLSLSLLASVGTVIPFKPTASPATVAPFAGYVFQPINSMTMRAGENISIASFVKILNNRLFLADKRSRPVGVSMNNASIGQPVRVLVRGLATVRSA